MAALMAMMQSMQQDSATRMSTMQAELQAQLSDQRRELGTELENLANNAHQSTPLVQGLKSEVQGLKSEIVVQEQHVGTMNTALSTAILTMSTGPTTASSSPPAAQPLAAGRASTDSTATCSPQGRPTQQRGTGQTRCIPAVGSALCDHCERYPHAQQSAYGLQPVGIQHLL
jgi:hypothetical protein